MTCQTINTQYVAPGWGCCQCHTYNGAGRIKCKACGHEPCGIAPAVLAALRQAERQLLGPMDYKTREKNERLDAGEDRGGVGRVRDKEST